jgi:hypothetical protein
MNRNAVPDRVSTGRLPSALLVIVVLAFAAYVYVTNNRSDPSVVTTEPANSPSSRPGFIPTANVDVIPQQSVHTIGHVATGDTGGHVVTGNTAGLYGGTQTNTCDAAGIGVFLDGHPALAGAWAQTLRIQQSDIHPFLASLTPLTLRTDTAVTNHGYANGVATPFQSVLQAGTAVLVDAEGLPRVRCRCGNPLQTPAPRVNIQYEGATWKGFEPESVTTVAPAAKQVTQFVVVKIDNTVVVQPRGTDGDADTAADQVTTQSVSTNYEVNGSSAGTAGPLGSDSTPALLTSGEPGAATNSGETASSTASSVTSGTADPTAVETTANTSASTDTGSPAPGATTDTGNAQETNGQTAGPGDGTAPTGNPGPGNPGPGNPEPDNAQPGNQHSEPPASDGGEGASPNDSDGGGSAQNSGG